jgi:hypothetical protein
LNGLGRANSGDSVKQLGDAEINARKVEKEKKKQMAGAEGAGKVKTRGEKRKAGAEKENEERPRFAAFGFLLRDVTI